MQIRQIVSHLPVWQTRQTNTEKQQDWGGKNRRLRKDLLRAAEKVRRYHTAAVQVSNQVQAITAQVNPGSESSRGCRGAVQVVTFISDGKQEVQEISRQLQSRM